ncbi:MAG TPA: NCS2 family permease [Vicinamibacterales bacterium]|nr:NCS2 family permease [Vicinamibacterales bacterium]
MIQRFFELDARGTTVAREIRGGVATFITMAYILLANPAILAAGGVPFEGAVAATAAASAVTCFAMGLLANAPIALAPGMGLNAIVAYQVAAATGSWQAAMALVVIEGVLVLALVMVGLREAVMDAIPIDLRRAIGVGIGLFIAFIGAVNARLVIVPPATARAVAESPSAVMPPVTFGSLRQPDALIALVGLLVIAALFVRRRTGAILLGIGAATLLALLVGVTHLPEGRWAVWPRFETVFQLDFRGLWTLAALPLLLSLVMVDFFDTIGTATALGDVAGLKDDRGRIPRLRRVLAIDAAGASIGGFAGASSVTSYIESAAGIAEGARTGLHTVVVGLLFALSAFLAPLAAIVPAAATAPALIAVGFLMVQQMTRIDVRALDTALPAFLILLLIPLTWSIAHGIGYGFIAFAAIRVLTGRARDVHPLMYGTASAFAAYFVLE